MLERMGFHVSPWSRSVRRRSPCPARVRSRRVARRVNAQVAENVAIRRRLQSACKRIRDAAQGLYSPPCARFDALRRDLAPPYLHVYGGAHFAAPHGRDAPHAADHRRRRRRERKMWRSRTPKYPSADRQRARGRRCERNRDVYRHAPVATDTSGRVCDWRARRRREAVPEGTVAVRVSTHDTSIAQRFACKNSFFSVFSNCLPIVKLASDASTRQAVRKRMFVL